MNYVSLRSLGDGLLIVQNVQVVRIVETVEVVEVVEVVHHRGQRSEIRDRL